MPLYTRTGDDGTTGLYGGGRINKDSIRIHAVGDVDELNATLGVIGDDTLQPLQAMLFELGADIATEDDQSRITQSDIQQIETWIDQVDQENVPLKSFVLPGGSDRAAWLHFARTVCRRAERGVIALHRSGGCTSEAIILLNRISDLLFALARQTNKEMGVSDISWTPREKD